MGNLKHAPEPWNIALYKAQYDPVIDSKMKERFSLRQIEAISKRFEAVSIGTNDGQTCIVPLDESNIENANRIVECVNAMAGIQDPIRWMEEAKEILNKVLDFEHPDLKIGESKIDFLIKLAENGSKK